MAKAAKKYFQYALKQHRNGPADTLKGALQQGIEHMFGKHTKEASVTGKACSDFFDCCPHLSALKERKSYKPPDLPAKEYLHGHRTSCAAGDVSYA